ncbi:hypothetical protein H6G36_28130 [Anabaena minutissima FACHB-250]|nr:hypothetical protein [Anabaena minutissima FACHB-250]
MGISVSSEKLRVQSFNFGVFSENVSISNENVFVLSEDVSISYENVFVSSEKCRVQNYIVVGEKAIAGDNIGYYVAEEQKQT